jgi:uncharacterized protein DUF4157
MTANRLSTTEHAALGTLGTAVDCGRVRLFRDAEGTAGLIRRIVLAASRNRAIALGNRIFLPDAYRSDLAVLAHELTHCGQYQTWGPLKYFTKGAATQLRYLAYQTLRIGSNPYRYQPEPGKDFDSYGMEQQGQIVEDCFRGDPAARALSPFQPGRDRSV